MRKVTMEDLANELGVSRSTVSRALRGDPQIALATRERVQQLATRRGYRPNAAAQALNRRRTGVIGLRLPRSSRVVFGNPYFSELLHGAADAADAAGYPLLVSTAAEPDYGVWAHEGRVDGLILLGSSVRSADIPALNALVVAGFPLVVIHAAPESLRAATVGSDERGGVRAGVRHLRELGHRRVAFVTGPLGSPYAGRRYDAFVQARREFGLEPDDRLVIEGDDTQRGGERAVERLLAAGHPFGALIANNDLAAVGALRALEDGGLRVPDDVSLVGFDDTPLARLVRPALTTVKQPVAEIGRHAVEMLLALIRDRDAGGAAPGRSPAATILPTTLVVRSSTRSAPRVRAAPPRLRTAARGGER